MKQTVRKGTVALLLTALIAMTCVGCGSDGINTAESSVVTYLTAVSGFNLDVMESFLAEGTNADYGIDTSVMESGYSQTDTYKKAVEDMFKALSATMAFTIDACEMKTEDTAVVSVTIKCADANETAVGEYMQQKVNEYAQAHPVMFQLSEVEQNDVAISVMADAYKEFLQLQPKIETKIDIAASKVDGKWKIASASENAALKEFFAGTYGTF